MASAVPQLGQCRVVACWLTDTPTPWVVVPRPEWPQLVHLAARDAGDRGVLTVLRFAGGARAQLVVMEMARQAAAPATPPTAASSWRTPDAGRARARRAQRAALTDVAGAGDAARDVPPDVVLALPGAGSQQGVAEHHVTGRAPLVVVDPGAEPVDERIFNPIGFRKDWDASVVDLADLGRGPVTECVVDAARAHQGVRPLDRHERPRPARPRRGGRAAGRARP